jgi:redox-sensitive bicupin YhaK (pirin superfamily)
MSDGPIIATTPLGFPWPTKDPFLVCVHHLDAYPRGNERLGPDASLVGHALGQDFAGKDGWRMYHGDVVPGFPHHPHRGFETVTIVRDGFIDHSDSLGATARFGLGDVQWLTAGGGIVHSEMFPLLDREKPNRLELFQIWVNLAARSKFAKPYFTMLWNEQIPRLQLEDNAARRVDVAVIAGEIAGIEPLPPPPDSWAANPDADLAIWTITLDADAEWTLPPARDARTGRTLYFFAGTGLAIDGRELNGHAAVEVHADRPVKLLARGGRAELLMLQSRPLGEPVAQYGPFVMNTRAELEQAFADYQRTRFGGWPFAADGPVFGREQGRFARHGDGRTEEPHGVIRRAESP